LHPTAPATADRQPIPGSDPVNATPQLAQPGLWSDRLPHFRSGFMPSAGEEIQSEYLVDRRHGPAAIKAILGFGDRIRPLLYVAEIRTIAADGLWMSPQHGRDTGRHPLQVEARAGVRRARTRRGGAGARAVRPAAALGASSSSPTSAKIAPLYERLPDFVALLGRLDPRGVFRNAWLERHLLR
jgi:xylitol oxidase